MNVDVLIDSIVRQTTLLIAQLATAAGVRAPLAHIANQVFVDLVKELRAQGLGQKVIADMFGMALRTYHAKMRRLSESHTFTGRRCGRRSSSSCKRRRPSSGLTCCADFATTTTAGVRAVLRDLVDSGILFATGRDERTMYRMGSAEEYRAGSWKQEREGLVSLVLVALNRYAPATARELAVAIPLDEQVVRGALDELVKSGRAEERNRGWAGPLRMRELRHPARDFGGLEAAVFDHFQAMVTAIWTKLRMGRPTLRSRIGWAEARTASISGRSPPCPRDLGVSGHDAGASGPSSRKSRAYNREHPGERPETQRVIAYVGQTC